MADRDDWTWQEWGRASIGWRLSVVGRAAGRLLVLALRPPFLALRAARHRVDAVEPWGIMLAVIGLGLLLAAFWIDYTTLWKFVRDEVNNRDLIAIFTGGILVGTVAPLIAGVITFFLNAKIAARQAVYSY